MNAIHTETARLITVRLTEEQWTTVILMGGFSQQDFAIRAAIRTAIADATA